MQKVKRGPNSRVDDLKLVGGGEGFIPIWKIKDERTIQAVKKGKVYSIEKLPEGYLLEKRYLSIRLKAQWIMVPSSVDLAYGLIECHSGDCGSENMTTGLNGELKKGVSYHRDGKYLIIEDRLILNSDKNDWSVLLNPNRPHFPVLFCEPSSKGSVVIKAAWWLNGTHQKSANGLGGTKFTELARTLISEMS